MPKILSQSGVSLADTYDVEGSIAGVEELASREVSLFDEMGARVFSERLQSFLVASTSGNLNQSTAWNVTIGDFPDSPNRLLGISVLSGTAARVDYVTFLVSDQDTGREIPIWSWDVNDDAEVRARWSFDGGAVGESFLLRSGGYRLPQLLTREGTSQQMPELQFRGITSAFGAGTVTVRAVLHVARANPNAPVPAGVPSSHGLPIPSW